MSAVTPSAVPVLGLPWERGARPPLTGDWWTRGLSLADRLAAPGGPPPAPADDEQTARAGRRLRRWREAFPGVTADAAVPVLDAHGLTGDDLRDLLAEPAASLAARAVRPDWARWIEETVAAMPAGAPDEAPDPLWQRGFVRVVRPFVDAASAALAGSPEYAAARDLVDLDAFVAAFRHRLGGALAELSSRILVMELNVMRVAGRLAGTDATERFWSFVALLGRPAELGALLDEYAVLARAVATAARAAVAVHAEFLGRFAADRAALVATMFDGADPGSLTQVEMGGGDAHDRGRSVALLRFADGARLVYKPRPLELHAHVNAILDRYAELLPDIGPRTVRVVRGDGYGWTEFVAPAGCADEAALGRYHRRLGALLAVVYALAGTDFHFENLIACGEYPVLVDLESLFHVDLPAGTGDAFVDDDPALAELGVAVTRTGLLPAMVFGADGGVLDLGGMGGDRGGLLPFRSVGYDGAGTDRMHLVRDYREFPGSQNRPSLAGSDVDPQRYAADLLAGFRAGYRVLVAHREALAGPAGPLAACADDEARCIVRATRSYMTVLGESSHPDVGRDALDKERVLSLLRANIAADAARGRLVGHELVDLWAGDVPLFRSRVGGRDLWSTAGERIADALEESGLDRSRRILARMGESDLATQEWIIRASLATRATADPAATPAATGRGIRTEGTIAQRALRHAIRIADGLETTAYHHGDRIGWLGMDLARDTQWTVTRLHADLYNGLPGVGLFLAALAAVTRDQRHADLAARVLAPLPAHVAHTLRSAPPADTPGLSGPFTGPPGIAYALACCATLLGDPALAAPVVPLLDRAADLVGADTGLDVVGGAAGCLALAEALTDGFGAPAARLAARCAARLVETAVPAGDGVGWPSGDAHRPLLGFSHGAAGAGWALLRHAARTGAPDALRTGRAALAYEHAGYLPAAGNWPDHRILPARPWDDGGPVTALHAWCHGAPGIGLARADLPAALRTGETDADLALALRSTAAAGSLGNHSLCHGDLGNLELFAVADVPGAADLRDRAAAAVLADLDRVGPLCGTPFSVPTPGLMTGLAGIGYGLLRIAAPATVPSVLLLRVPHVGDHR